MTVIETSVLSTSEIPDGYSFTLTSRMSQIILAAERYCGERDKSYTILGVEFVIDRDYPQIWFPNNCKHIAIQLTREAATNMANGCYQLAHEIIHCISPKGSASANILEEGLATFFAGQYVKQELNINMTSSVVSYQNAMALTESLLKQDIMAIKKLREKAGFISNITSEQILETFPSFDPNEAKKLCMPFNRNDT